MSIDIDVFKNNFKNATIYWALDECIGKKTDYDGGNPIECAKEIYNLLTYIDNQNLSLDMKPYVINSINIFFKATQYFSSLVNTQEIESITNSDIILYHEGWEDHAISIFFYKNKSLYNVGLINFGEGTEYHGIENDKSNGIIIFENITIDKIKDFLAFKKIFTSNQKIKANYNIYYSMLFHCFGNLKSTESIKKNKDSKFNLNDYKLISYDDFIEEIKQHYTKKLEQLQNQNLVQENEKKRLENANLTPQNKQKYEDELNALITTNKEKYTKKEKEYNEEKKNIILKMSIY